MRRRFQTHLIVPLRQELQPLGSLVHEDPVQVSRLHGADLDGLLPPTHDLIGVDVGCRDRRADAARNLDQLMGMHGLNQTGVVSLE